MFNAIGSIPFGEQGDNDFFLDVIMDGYDQSIALQVARNVRGDSTKIRRYFNNMWQNWTSYITNSDFKREIHARFPFMVYGNNLYVSYAFPIKFSTPPNISINHVDIDGYGSPDTQEVWMVNTDTVCFKFTKSTMNLQNGQCYMGQVRFMIS